MSCPSDAGLRPSWSGAVRITALALLMSLSGGKALAEDQAAAQEPRIFLQFGAYAHYTQDDEDEREGPPVVAAIEWLKPNRTYYGLSLFNNSFGQFSQFVYVGKEFPLRRFHEYLRARLSVGIVHGYEDEHEDDLPLNYKDFAPGLVPSLGFKKDGYAVDVVLLSNAAIMLNLGFDIEI